MIPISAVELDAEVEQLVLQVLRSGQLAQGPLVAELEQIFARATGTEQAVAVTSGTTALVAAMEVCDLQPGDEVLTSPFTFAATLNAILEAGATATFADISTDDFALDPEAVTAAVTDRTKVLMPVHLYGQPAAMTELAAVAAGEGLLLVEDAAQAHGASVDGQPVGSYGLGCFSLYATKNVTTGEGGIITTNDGDRADRLRVLRNQGMRARYEYVVPGHNYRMTDLQAAVGIPQLRRLDEIIAARAANAAYLTDGLAGVPGLALPAAAEGRRHVWHQYTVRVLAEARCNRDELAVRLANDGVGTGIYYPRVVFDYECYLHHPGVVVSDVPRARAAAGEVLSLPVHPRLSADDLDRVVASVRRHLGD